MVNTGDNLAHPKAVPAVVQALGDLLSVPGVFVFGSNDYFGPRLKNPANYLTKPSHRVARRAAAVAGPAGGVHRARLAGHDAHAPRVRGGRAAHRRRGRRRPAPEARPLRDHRRARRPDREPAAGPDALAGAPGAGPVRRRRLPAGDGRPHPRRPALPAVLRRDRHQLRPRPVAGQGRVAVGRQHGAARLGGHRHLAVRSAAVLLPARGDAVDVGGRARPAVATPERGRANPTRPLRCGDRRGLESRLAASHASGWTMRFG